MVGGHALKPLIVGGLEWAIISRVKLFLCKIIRISGSRL